MKSLLITIVLIRCALSFGQDITSQNFHEYIEGTWVYDGFCNEKWEKESWMCVDSNKIDSTGIVISTRICEGMDEPMITKSQWTRFDPGTMKIYAKSYDDFFGTGWTEEHEVYTVVKFTENEIWLEAEAISEGSSETRTLRVIYRRI